MATLQRVFSPSAFALAVLALAHPAAQGATTQYATGSPAFTWGTDAKWAPSSGGSYVDAWTNGNDAVFEGTAGTITINNPTAQNLLFNITGYILSGASTLTLNGTTPTITTGSGISATIGDNTATVIGGSAGLAKAGTGMLTLNGSAAHTFTGALNLSKGKLALDFANMGTPTDLLNSAVTPTLGGGTLAITGKSSGSTSQTLGNVTMTAGTPSKILLDPNGGTGTTLALGTMPVWQNNVGQNNGSTLLIGKLAGAGSGTTTITTTTATGYINGAGRVLYSDGAGNVDFVLKVAAGTALTPVSSYTTLTAANSGSQNTTPYSLLGSLTRTAVMNVGVLKITSTAANEFLNFGGFKRVLRKPKRKSLILLGILPIGFLRG